MDERNVVQYQSYIEDLEREKEEMENAIRALVRDRALWSTVVREAILAWRKGLIGRVTPLGLAVQALEEKE